MITIHRFKRFIKIIRPSVRGCLLAVNPAIKPDDWLFHCFHFISEHLWNGLLVEKADLLDDVHPQIWLAQLAADLEDQLSELVHHHFGKLLVVDLGREEAHGIGEAAEKLRAELGKVGHEELVEPPQEQLQGRDVMLGLVTICLAHCELHLHPDVLKDH